MRAGEEETRAARWKGIARSISRIDGYVPDSILKVIGR
jgi:hypothetical protein